MSYNPGYQNLLKGLKPSTRQRFIALSLGYPKEEVEREIVEHEGQVSGLVASRLVRLASALRRLTEHDLEETVSTRLLVMAARLVASGMTLFSACQVAIVEALTDDVETATSLSDIVKAVVGDED